MAEAVRTRVEGPVLVVTIDRPERRNAVDRPTAELLERTFREFDRDEELFVAVLTGADQTFSAGADLVALSSGDPTRASRLEAGTSAPMGPTRLALSKPVIAAVEGYAVAGGLELAVWCDLRVAGRDARFGVSSRRFGVPLIDGGTIRLPQLIGLSRALELILTAEIVDAEFAHRIGLVNRLVPTGQAEKEAIALAQQLASFPQLCMRADRRNARESCGVDSEAALNHEFGIGSQAIQAGETIAGATRFSGGAGRHGILESSGHAG